MAAMIRKFNWADATDSDDEVLSSPEQTLILREEGGKNVNGQLPSTPVRQKAPAPAVPTSTHTCGGGLSEDDNSSSNANSASESPALNAVRELDFSDGCGMTPLRHCQEVTIQAAIPYKLKSVWNANNNSNNGTTPSAKLASNTGIINIINNNPSTTLSSTPRNGIAASVRPAPLRKMNRAVDELTNVLRANDGSLPYDELMVKAQWRSRFQPSFGSLFTFIKRNREIFRYKQSVVELMQEASIVTELLKINWPSSASSTVSPSKI